MLEHNGSDSQLFSVALYIMLAVSFYRDSLGNGQEMLSDEQQITW